ncbi:nucleotidyltransferase family protein [Sphaerotilus sp.]|jgi:molybdenum cofactor cytidylyltransferase|uniref:nucleotidyltransferase family protein n=1 Tax=Sphaerotilus sp. TaxID=2093942 RepID=UPI00286E3EE1|nr:nucleotidyltransferase family protein [Sphaerotilus sp.]
MIPTRSLPTVVVLAAGGGTRFEGAGPKLGQTLGPASVLAHTLDAVVSAGMPLVVVTVAALVDVARSVVASRDIILLPPVGSASREPLGVGFSIAAGVSARPHVPGWLILPGDMPLVRPETLRAVARALDSAPVAYAQHRGRQGFPVGLSAELYSELVLLSGEEGLRRLLVRYPSNAVEVTDPGVLQDINTTADLERLRASSTVVAWQQSVSAGQPNEA